MKKKSQPVDQAPAPVQVPEESPSQPESGRFPIVGIGASAGGLEALEQFVARVPANSGMAFVIVQHLDPTSKGIMPYRTRESRIDGVVITLTDITAAKKLEAELRETGAFYRALFETMPAGVLFQNTAGTVTFANPAAEHILGLTLERMAEQPTGDPRWQTVHEDGSPFPAETHPAMVALKTGRPVHNVVMGRCNPSSGQRVRISIGATPFSRAGEDKPSQVSAVFHDITGQKKG